MNETKSILPAKIGGAEITRFNALERGRAEALDAAREQDQATPRRQCRNSLTVSAQAEGHVAANL